MLCWASALRNPGKRLLTTLDRTEQGHSIDFRYKGVIRMADDVKKIFEFKPDMATVPFGYASKLGRFFSSGLADRNSCSWY